MADSYVQVPADGVGKKIDNSVLTQDDGLTVAYRQRVNVSDAVLPDAHLDVDRYDSLYGEYGAAVRVIPGPAERDTHGLLFEILQELRDARGVGAGGEAAGRDRDPVLPFRVKALATTNATLVRGGLTELNGWYLFNAATTVKWLKLYDLARQPAPAVDTPVFTLPLPAGGGAVVGLPLPLPFFNGLAFTITGAATDTDATAVAADDVHGVLLYRQFIHEL